MGSLGISPSLSPVFEEEGPEERGEGGQGGLVVEVPGQGGHGALGRGQLRDGRQEDVLDLLLQAQEGDEGIHVVGPGQDILKQLTVP